MSNKRDNSDLVNMIKVGAAVGVGIVTVAGGIMALADKYKASAQKVASSKSSNSFVEPRDLSCIACKQEIGALPSETLSCTHQLHAKCMFHHIQRNRTCPDVNCRGPIPNSVVEAFTRGLSSICDLCLKPLQPNQDVEMFLCGHRVHQLCMPEWIAIATNCPACKHELPADIVEKYMALRGIM